MIIQSGIREVVYYSDKHKAKPETVASKRMLDMSGVAFRRFVPKMRSVVVDFGTIDDIADKMAGASVNENGNGEMKKAE